MNGHKPLYVPWNEEEFRGDVYVSAMSPLQRWMYRTLLQTAFFHSTRPYLPDDDNLLWMLAGCENKQQWLDNAETIRAMFSTIEIDGKNLLSQKRLLLDWDRLEERRTALSERGRSGGLATANRVLSDAQASKVKGSKDKESEENISNRLLRPRDAFKEIPKACRQILGIRPEPIEWHKQEIKELVDAYGGAKVVEAFEQWAEANCGRSIPKPILEFIKTADGLLQGIISGISPEDVDSLINALAEISDGEVLFGDNAKSVISKWLREYTSVEITQAFTLFYQTVTDPKDLKYADKNFAEKGLQLLHTLRKKKQEAEMKDRLVSEQIEKDRERIAAEIAEIDRQNAEEDALVEFKPPVEEEPLPPQGAEENTLGV